MTSKTKQIIMAAIGAYLVYTGISLVKDTIVGEPKNQILFILVEQFGLEREPYTMVDTPPGHNITQEPL